MKTTLKQVKEVLDLVKLRRDADRPFKNCSLRIKHIALLPYHPGIFIIRPDTFGIRLCNGSSPSINLRITGPKK
jgi:hypothetical protein